MAIEKNLNQSLTKLCLDIDKIREYHDQKIVINKIASRVDLQDCLGKVKKLLENYREVHKNYLETNSKEQLSEYDVDEHKAKKTKVFLEREKLKVFSDQMKRSKKAVEAEIEFFEKQLEGTQD